MNTLHGIAAVGLFLVAGAAAAGIGDPVNLRQYDQAERIRQGVLSGSLTRSEAARLRTEQRVIRSEERVYRSDGVLTAFERADLRHDLDVASRDIRIQKHDRQRRY